MILRVDLLLEELARGSRRFTQIKAIFEGFESAAISVICGQKTDNLCGPKYN